MNIVITGGTSGIGFETAKHLANSGNQVIVASLDTEKGHSAIEQLNQWCQEMNSDGEVDFFALDLSILSNVRTCADAILAKYPTIDMLICNAGIMNAPYRMTADGYESQFEINFLGHFYLTQLLIERLSQAPNAKVINVCSSSAEKGVIHDIESLAHMSKIPEAEFVTLTSYREAKLAQQVSVMHMSRMPEYKDIAFSLIHPGIVNSNLFYNGKSKLYKLLMKPFVYLGYLTGRLQTPEKGAETTIYLAENDYPSGTYWHKDKQIPTNLISQDEDYGAAVYSWAKSLTEQASD